MDRTEFHWEPLRVRRDDRIVVCRLTLLLVRFLSSPGNVFDLVHLADGLDILEPALDARFLIVNLVERKTVLSVGFGRKR